MPLRSPRVARPGPAGGWGRGRRGRGSRRAIGGRAADATAVGLEPGQAGRCDRVRRASPAIAGPLFVLVIVAAVVAGGLFVASLPGGVDSGVVALATTTPKPTRTPRPTARPTPVAGRPADRRPHADARSPSAATKPPARGARDLCDPILGFACGLEKGTYEPSRFEPPIRFKLRDGWSTSLWEADLIALGRQEGGLTFASGLLGVYPNGDATDAPRSRRSLIETFIVTDGVAAGRPHDIRVDKRRATVVDLAPTGPDRVALFGTSTQTFFLEADRHDPHRRHRQRGWPDRARHRAPRGLDARGDPRRGRSGRGQHPFPLN